MKFCVKCGKPVDEPITTAYGDKRCPDCFDDYLMTDRGKVEYFIGLANGELNIKDFDADFLGHVAVCCRCITFITASKACRRVLISFRRRCPKQE